MAVRSGSSPHDAPPPGGSVRVAFVASEAVPFAKTGGLADVAGSLPLALSRLGVEVTLVMPLYRHVRESGAMLRAVDGVGVLAVEHGPQTIEVRLEIGELGDGAIRVVFVRYDPYYDRSELYFEDGEDYPDNARRFGLFARTVPLAMEALSIPVDIYHLNDWQTALVAAHLRSAVPRGLAGARSVLTIHNIDYQGLFRQGDLPWTGLPYDVKGDQANALPTDVNFLRTGVTFADAITTVSPTYARQIQTVAGGGLEDLLRRRSRDLVGIVNGIDTTVWDPSRDPHLPAAYSSDDRSGKAACKAALQKELGLPVDADAPLIGSIGRLVEQKGVHLLVSVADELFAESGCQLAVLGRGEDWIEQKLQILAERFPDRAGVVVGFSERLAHLIEAASDMFVMPSRTEPCGLNQLYSMAYGTVPVVHRTGGLADTVVDDDDIGTGFVFDTFGEASLLEALRRALAAYRSGAKWEAIVGRTMAADWSWDRSAGEYAALYRSVLSRPAGGGTDVSFPKKGLRP